MQHYIKRNTGEYVIKTKKQTIFHVIQTNQSLNISHIPIIKSTHQIRTQHNKKQSIS